MATKKTATKKKTAKKSTAKKKAPVLRGTPTLADLRRIARSIVTSTSVVDEKRMMALYSESIESEEVAGGNRPALGIEALKQKGEDWNKRVSDARWHARNLWCDGQTVIIEWEAQLAMKPGGRKVLHREVAIHEVRNGKIVRERFYYDPGPLG
ncbi:MAG: nuclear transport factor 2 family protein [Candidatus Binatia bacterium]|nr:nuclear transport factor 2 family protein [Candidatus Binatia bacterium]